VSALSRPNLSLGAALLLATLFLLPAHALWGSKNKANEEAGALLFRDKGCVHCHGVGGVGTKKAPSLVDIRKNKQWTPEKMTSQILNGGKKMPPFADSLSDQEVAQIIAYLRAKHRPVPPPLPPTA
jgi:mono/diheme cytochrome c family protein